MFSFYFFLSFTRISQISSTTFFLFSQIYFYAYMHATGIFFHHIKPKNRMSRKPWLEMHEKQCNIRFCKCMRVLNSVFSVLHNAYRDTALSWKLGFVFLFVAHVRIQVKCIANLFYQSFRHENIFQLIYALRSSKVCIWTVFQYFLRFFFVWNYTFFIVSCQCHCSMDVIRKVWEIK